MIPESSKPYIIRALYEWCMDEGYTPHVVVTADKNCQVPRAYVKDGNITLNIGAKATKNLFIDNQWISFAARFNGYEQDVMFPVATVAAFYTRETQEGMGFVVNPNYVLKDESKDENDKSSASASSEKKGFRWPLKGGATDPNDEAPKGKAKVLKLIK